MSCNSPKDRQRWSRTGFIKHLKEMDPDLLFFAGDQNYTHEEGTYGWLQFGYQFREVMKDRPTICIVDDHDIRQPNLWGAGGLKSNIKAETDGGYTYPASFVNMVQRQQIWNLPDAFDPTPILRGITVYYTEHNLGGISFAILEDRKFKSQPEGNVPQMGPRADHINDPAYDRNSVNLPGLKLLGERQHAFLNDWIQDWTDDQLKVVLSQTAFTGAVHIHGSLDGRLLADLDSNAWPQAGRDQALRYLRAARATHLCGDQHLGVVVRHGIEEFRDGPISFTSPALVNAVYKRLWWPLDEPPGGGDAIDSSLPWVGDYLDGFGNRITMHAYANPAVETVDNKQATENRGDGYGIALFNKRTNQVTFEAWPRFSDPCKGDVEQFEGWPLTFDLADNDGRKVYANLPDVTLPSVDAVVCLTNAETGEVIYSYRANEADLQFQPYVYAPGVYNLKIGKNQPTELILSQVRVD